MSIKQQNSHSCIDFRRVTCKHVMMLRHAQIRWYTSIIEKLILVRISIINEMIYITHDTAQHPESVQEYHLLGAHVQWIVQGPALCSGELFLHLLWDLTSGLRHAFLAWTAWTLLLGTLFFACLLTLHVSTSACHHIALRWTSWRFSAPIMQLCKLCRFSFPLIAKWSKLFCDFCYFLKQNCSLLC